MRRELVELAILIDWSIFEREWPGSFPSHTGRRTIPLRISYRRGPLRFLCKWQATTLSFDSFHGKLSIVFGLKARAFM